MIHYHLKEQDQNIQLCSTKSIMSHFPNLFLKQWWQNATFKTVLFRILTVGFEFPSWKEVSQNKQIKCDLERWSIPSQSQIKLMKRLAWSVLWFMSHSGLSTKNKITPHFIWSAYSKQLTGVIHLFWNSLSLASFSELWCSWWGYRKDVENPDIKVSEERRNLQSSQKTTTGIPELPQMWIIEPWEGHLRSAASPLPWSCRALREQRFYLWALGFFLSTINDTLESKDNSKDFALKGRVWFHVQSRLPQKPAESNEDFRALSYPCHTRHL